MREIKFRAWNMATKMMIDLKKITPLILNIDTDGLFIPFSDGLPLMQYTGLKDKNDKEIYEGDIVHWEHLDYPPEIVTWIQEDCAFAAEKLNGEPGSWLDSTCTIIGNIYENSELLKEDK